MVANRDGDSSSNRDVRVRSSAMRSKADFTINNYRPDQPDKLTWSLRKNNAQNEITNRDCQTKETTTGNSKLIFTTLPPLRRSPTIEGA